MALAHISILYLANVPLTTAPRFHQALINVAVCILVYLWRHLYCLLLVYLEFVVRIVVAEEEGEEEAEEEVQHHGTWLLHIACAIWDTTHVEFSTPHSKCTALKCNKGVMRFVWPGLGHEPTPYVTSPLKTGNISAYWGRTKVFLKILFPDSHTLFALNRITSHFSPDIASNFTSFFLS